MTNNSAKILNLFTKACKSEQRLPTVVLPCNFLNKPVT